MNRKILAGAAASLMLTALPVTFIGTAGAALPASTVTSFTITHDAQHQYLSNQQLGYTDDWTMVITGTGFNNGTYTPDTFPLGVHTRNSIVFKNDSIVVDTVTRNSSTQLTVEGHNGVSAGATKPNKQEKLTVVVPTGGSARGGNAKLTAGPTLVSNCGYNFPVAQPGHTYAVDGDGNQVINADGSNYTGNNSAVTYFAVSVDLLNNGVPGILLCAADLIKPAIAPTSTPTWGINYPINFSGTTGENLTALRTNPNYGAGKVKAIGFNFPYTSATHLKVIGSVTTYKVSGVKLGNCTIDPANTIGNSSCELAANGKTLTVTSTDTREYDQGGTIQSPLARLTNVTAKGANVTLTPISNVSTIDLGGSNLNIIFSPLKGTGSYSYAPVSLPISAS
jgi:hypothetical protein